MGELFPLFHEALAHFCAPDLGPGAPPFLQLGKQLFLLEDVIMTNDDPADWTGFTSLPHLIEQAKQMRFHREATLMLEFASLTAFSRGIKKVGYGPHLLLLPLTQFVFQNLARRREDIAPPELAGMIQRERLEIYLQEDGVIIADYGLKPHHVHFTTHDQRGFLGRCTYQLRGPLRKRPPTGF